MNVRGNGHFVVTKKILLAAVEIVKRTVDAIVQDREVESDIPVFTFFPSKIGIDILAGAPNLEILTIVIIVAEAAHCVDRQIAAEVLVAGLAIVGTDFKVVDPRYLFHKLFLRYTPTCRNGGEITPFVVFTEF